MMKSNKRRTRYCTVTGIAALALLAAGCGDGSGESAGSGAAQGVTDDTIKVGLLAPLSGPSAVYGKGNHTIESMYKELNAQGGINGRKIELVIEDTKCDPATTRIAVTKLIQQEKVFMLHGGMCSAGVVASIPIIEQSGIPFLVAGAASHDIVDPPKKNVFHGWVDNSSGTAMNAKLLASFIKETGKSRVGIIAQSDEWGQGWLSSFQASLAAEPGAAGAEIVIEEEMAPNITDATAQVQKLKNANVDIAIVYAYPDPMSVFLRNAEQQGLDIPVVTGQGTFPEDQLDRIGSAGPVEDFYAAYCMAAPLTSPELAPYRDAVKKHYPKDAFDLSSMLGVSGYDLNAAVLEEMGDDLTWDNWISTAEGVQDLQSSAAPGPLSFKAFDADDPSSRLGVASCNVSHLNSDPAAEEKIVVTDPDWSKAIE